MASCMGDCSLIFVLNDIVDRITGVTQVETVNWLTNPHAGTTDTKVDNLAKIITYANDLKTYSLRKTVHTGGEMYVVVLDLEWYI